MKLSKFSHNKLMATFDKWRVDRDFAEPMYNYLVHGFEPGSCFTSVLANDFYRAMNASHPANTVVAFKALVNWIRDYVPYQARGTYKAVNAWCKLTEDERRAVLEEHKLIYTGEEETWKILNDEQPEALGSW